MAKEKRQSVPVRPAAPASSLDALLAESRALRRQVADDLSRDAQPRRRISRERVPSREQTDPDD
jgi:hypothetical protein